MISFQRTKDAQLEASIGMMPGNVFLSSRSSYACDSTCLTFIAVIKHSHTGGNDAHAHAHTQNKQQLQVEEG